MKSHEELYLTPDAMEPLFPKDDSGVLQELAITLIEKSAKLSGSLNPVTRLAIARLLRPMNSYYSNLIEGHDTHPIEIEKALNKNYSDDIHERNLQLEAFAHIYVYGTLIEEINENPTSIIPTDEDYIKSIHKRFYEFLPDEFKKVKTKEGVIKDVVPGEFRTSEVEIGRHVAPASSSLNVFMERFSAFYNPENSSNSSKIKRVISIAASHHRLVWIHPFLDGNGRVVRLFSDAMFMHEGIHASGLWSISRGLARAGVEYKKHLSKADLLRLNNYDGRGNLSNKMLVEFCEFFLKIAIDQVEFMSSVIDSDKMLARIEKFSDFMIFKEKFKSGAKDILVNVFLKGRISKVEAMRITKTSDKTLKNLTDKLKEMGLLVSIKEGKSMMYCANYPIRFSPLMLPGLFPLDKEIDMINKID